MPELVRSVVSRVRLYFKDRRQSPRLRVRLMFTVAIHRTANGNAPRRKIPTLKGHTRDISVRGVGLLVPQVHLDGHHLAAEGRELELQLEIGGGGPISMRVMPHHYERLDEAEMGCNYLIGARIVKLDEADQTRYANFVTQGLKNPSADGSS
jgi:c-di-GMP-binding flagellar brake protein YcgR